jgi:hypothetical protein
MDNVPKKQPFLPETQNIVNSLAVQKLEVGHAALNLHAAEK